MEFLTSFLNNAANEDDIRNGTSYAERIGIRVTPPRWGFSKSNYAFDKEKHVIAKGLSSIKYMSDGLGEELYEIAHDKYDDPNYLKSFMNVLDVLSRRSKINARQLEILVKLDFFCAFGNQRELMYMIDIFTNLFNKGDAKQVSKEKIDGTPLEPIVKKYAIGVTKNGQIAKKYTLLDVHSILIEAEEAVRKAGLEDVTEIEKVRSFNESTGYAGYVSGKEEDKRKLLVMDVFPLKRKKDGVVFGASITTKSIGSGKESRMSVHNRDMKEEIKKGDIIYCNSWRRDGRYLTLLSYSVIH